MGIILLSLLERLFFAIENYTLIHICRIDVTLPAFTLDAKRNERPGKNNDLWDMIEQFRRLGNSTDETLSYFQPAYHTERWRLVDKRTLSIFDDNSEVVRWQDKAASIHELFADLPSDPSEAAKIIEERHSSALQLLAKAYLNEAAYNLTDVSRQFDSEDEIFSETDHQLWKAATPFKSLVNQQKKFFDPEDQTIWQLFQKACQRELEGVIKEFTELLVGGDKIERVALNTEVAILQMAMIAIEFARLDGYNVVLRSKEMLQTNNLSMTPKSWIAPVRTYAKNNEWQSEDGTLKGSHDEHGKLRPEYLETIALYDEKNNLIDGLLDPDCIEARGWKLSAGQYKPFTFKAVRSEKGVLEMVRDLKEQEKKIVAGLDKLLAMVEGRE